MRPGVALQQRELIVSLVNGSRIVATVTIRKQLTPNRFQASTVAGDRFEVSLCDSTTFHDAGRYCSTSFRRLS